jgi:hypothetical protein
MTDRHRDAAIATHRDAATEALGALLSWLHAEKNGSVSLAHRSELKAARERAAPLLDGCEYDDAVFRAFRLAGRELTAQRPSCEQELRASSSR